MNCQKGYLSLYWRSDAIVMYSFRKAGEAQCELDKFISRFINNPLYQQDFQNIMTAIEYFKLYGVNSRRFRRMGEGSVEALHAGECALRLYCIPYGRRTIIIGNGGIKTRRLVQNCPDCKPHWELLVHLEQAMQNSILEKDIRLVNTVFEGNHYFELGDCD